MMPDLRGSNQNEQSYSQSVTWQYTQSQAALHICTGKPQAVGLAPSLQCRVRNLKLWVWHQFCSAVSGI